MGSRNDRASDEVARGLLRAYQNEKITGLGKVYSFIRHSLNFFVLQLKKWKPQNEKEVKTWVLENLIHVRDQDFKILYKWMILPCDDQREVKLNASSNISDVGLKASSSLLICSTPKKEKDMLTLKITLPGLQKKSWVSRCGKVLEGSELKYHYHLFLVSAWNARKHIGINGSKK